MKVYSRMLVFAFLAILADGKRGQAFNPVYGDLFQPIRDAFDYLFPPESRQLSIADVVDGATRFWKSLRHEDDVLMLDQQVSRRISSTPVRPPIHRGLQSNSTSNNSSAAASSRPCSGHGTVIYQNFTNSPSCNNVSVPMDLQNAIEAMRSPGGDTAANNAALSAAVLILPAPLTFGALFPAGAVLPAGVNLTSSLSPPQQVIVQLALNISDLNSVRYVDQVFPSHQPPATSSGLILTIGPADISQFLTYINCTSARNAITSCACPLDYGGANCEIPFHYQCAVMMADPLYHACIAVNGKGFVPPLGGSGVAVPSSAQSLLDASAYMDVVASFDHVPRPPDSLEYNGYRTAIDGDPPCVFLNRSSSPTLVSLGFRVSCSFIYRNVTNNVTSGDIYVDPTGERYTAKAAYPGNTTIGILQRYQPPFQMPGVTSDYRCNGTVMTAAYVDQQLALRGQNRSTAPEPSPYYGLNCAELAFRYVSGGNSDFALSSAPVFPLAIHLRPISFTYLSSSAGIALFPIPATAMTGEVDVPVFWNVSSLMDEAGYWAGGRLYVEVKVVATPEGLMLPDGFTAGPPEDIIAASLMSPTSPLLILSNVYRAIIDDSTYVEPPPIYSLGLIIGLTIGLGTVLIFGTVILYFRWHQRSGHHTPPAQRRGARYVEQKDDDDDDGPAKQGSKGEAVPISARSVVTGMHDHAINRSDSPACKDGAKDQLKDKQL